MMAAARSAGFQPATVKPARGRRYNGFTLMEVLIASVLMGTAFVAAVSLMSQSLRNIERMQPHEQAMRHAREKMNETLLREQLALEHSSGRWSDGYRWRLDVAPEVDAKEATRQGGPMLFNIRVEVTWGSEQPRSYALQTAQLATAPPATMSIR
jgi:type II secretion system protein I